MQLVLPLDRRTQTLVDVHRRMQRHLGRPSPFLRLDPVSQLVMSLIGGRTRGEVSAAAFQALLMRFDGWEAVRDATVGEIEETIAGVTFADVKAKHLKAALEVITTAHGRLTLDKLKDLTVEDALVWLERLPGVGRKVAAATLNFSTLCMTALVIDTHHLRVLHRLGLIRRRSSSTQAYEHIMPLLPRDWSAVDFSEHHHLMKRLGQTVCCHGTPHCVRCPLSGLCPTASADTRSLRRD